MGNRLSNSNQYAHVFQQLVYIIKDDESVFDIKTIEFPGLTRNIDRILITAAILKQGGYTHSENDVKFITDSVRLGSVFYYYTSGRKFNIRNHEAFDAKWHRSQSEHWSYIVV